MSFHVMTLSAFLIASIALAASAAADPPTGAAPDQARAEMQTLLRRQQLAKQASPLAVSELRQIERRKREAASVLADQRWAEQMIAEDAADVRTDAKIAGGLKITAGVAGTAAKLGPGPGGTIYEVGRGVAAAVQGDDVLDQAAGATGAGGAVAKEAGERLKDAGLSDAGGRLGEASGVIGLGDALLEGDDVKAGTEAAKLAGDTVGDKVAKKALTKGAVLVEGVQDVKAGWGYIQEGEQAADAMVQRQARQSETFATQAEAKRREAAEVGDLWWEIERGHDPATAARIAELERQYPGLRAQVEPEVQRQVEQIRQEWSHLGDQVWTPKGADAGAVDQADLDARLEAALQEALLNADQMRDQARQDAAGAVADLRMSGDAAAAFSQEAAAIRSRAQEQALAAQADAAAAAVAALAGLPSNIGATHGAAGQASAGDEGPHEQTVVALTDAQLREAYPDGTAYDVQVNNISHWLLVYGVPRAHADHLIAQGKQVTGEGSKHLNRIVRRYPATTTMRIGRKKIPTPAH